MDLIRIIPSGTPPQPGQRNLSIRPRGQWVPALKRIVLLIIFCMSASEAAAQRMAIRSVDELAGNLQEAVMAADASTLMMLAAETVEVNLFGERRFYSRGQATLLLNDVFKEQRPTSSRIIRSRRTPSAAFVEAQVESVGERETLWLVRYALQRGEWRIRELTVEAVDE